MARSPLVGRRASRTHLEPLEPRTLLSFGVVSTGGQYVVDDGAQLKFSISQTNGDLTSIVYKGTQLEAPYSATSRYSHYESGLGTSTVTATVDNAAGTIVIAAASQGLPITQYYVARRGFDNLYMATYCSSATAPTPGEMRFITYLDNTKLTTTNTNANTKLADTTIESKDIFENSADGRTYSKYYSGHQLIANTANGDLGNGLGVWMVVGSHEKSSGGPFYKDIEQQNTSASDELYTYMYSGHAQTEAFRGAGVYGPYALVFNGGSQPVTPDFSFMGNVGITGWIGASGRGAIGGTAVGLPSGASGVVALSNGTAQYWANVGSGGAYKIAGVIPGTYTETLYAGQLAVGTQSVTVSAGKTAAANISDTLVQPARPLFTIGSWDGTPGGFLNAQYYAYRHPSDSRNTPWVPVTYTVGSSTAASFPAVEWRGVNDPTTIKFTLAAGQVGGYTLHINITDSFGGGRPVVVANAGQSYAWTSPTPAAPSGMPSGRSLTIGSFRGTNTRFTYNIPASALRAGVNTLTIHVVSGSGGTGFLSPSFAFDSIDMEAAATAAVATAAPPASASSVRPAVSAATVSPLLTAGDGPAVLERAAGVLEA